MIENAKILLIDDDPTQIAILTAYLASIGAHNVHDAFDGEQAKAIINQHDGAFDLVFTDLSMPKLDGFEFLKFLAEASFKGKLIIISGHEKILLESASSLAKMYGLSIIGQIRKPLTKQALDRLVSQEMSLQAPRRQTNQNEISHADIREGLANKEIIPFYQPKIDLLSGKVVGAEALARWVKPGAKPISPGAFLPIVEKFGMMGELTMAIFQQVMADCSASKPSWSGKKISVNLPPELLHDVSLPDALEKMVTDYKVKVSSICVEITESGIVDFDPSVVEVLARLRIKGFDLSIDDFGTGAANISNLKAFPYTELKIDQSFINNVLTDAFSAETVRTSISLARQLNLRIVAEGIENDAVLQYVKSKGIDQAQGYLFSKPVPVAAMNEMFASPLSWIAERKKQNQQTAA
ncbi:MAG: EAL domain-containing response regulator [Salaquimonas sp.]